MPKHWLLSAAARSLSLASVLRMSEDRACRWFYRARWGVDKPTCPACEVVDDTC